MDRSENQNRLENMDFEAKQNIVGFFDLLLTDWHEIDFIRIFAILSLEIHRSASLFRIALLLLI